MLLYQAHFSQQGIQAEREVKQYIQGHAENEWWKYIFFSFPLGSVFLLLTKNHMNNTMSCHPHTLSYMVTNTLISASQGSTYLQERPDPFLAPGDKS